MCILLGCVAACILFYIAYELISVIGEDFTRQSEKAHGFNRGMKA